MLGWDSCYLYQKEEVNEDAVQDLVDELVVVEDVRKFWGTSGVM